MMSSKPLWREPAGASTESVSVRSIESLNTPGPRRRFDAPSSSRSAPPSGRSVAFSIPEGFSGGRGGKCFSRAISSFSVWFSTRSPTKAAPTFSFCALNRSTSPSNRRTKPTSSVGVIRSSESLAPGDIPGLNQAFVNAPLPPGNLPRLPALELQLLKMSLTQFSTPLRLPPAMVPLSLLLLALALIGSTTTMMGVAAVAVFFLGGVLLWRDGESPILLFIFAYQWLQIVVAIFYAGWLGIDLNDYSTFHGDMQMAATLSLTALALLICGMRLGAGPAQPQDAQLARLAVSRSQM